MLVGSIIDGVLKREKLLLVVMVFGQCEQLTLIHGFSIAVLVERVNKIGNDID